ncbi:ACR3 family arsenite efflux transporter [Eisenibacter elegans]|uniref:ACR3 family arsenite efflux transporter n=1 Tax=Eisenibacter elegans TaxID=997 RepID=UPI000410C053|nr:ACR3 family arsenite efflux transporter [Eisenibacter elegans]
MSKTTTTEPPKRIGFFERYLSLWVALCIVIGVLLGSLMGDTFKAVSNWKIAEVNVPIAILVWLMIYPMMVQIDFSSLRHIKHNLRGLWLTLIVNWVVKPFSMALFAWLFFTQLYGAWISPELAKEYLAGAILLGAAPCTAMVFVWSYLSDGDANYTLVQVSVNDLVLLVAFIPIVQFLLGMNAIFIPFDTLIVSVIVFVVIPLVAGYFSYRWLMKHKGAQWFTSVFLPALKPVSIVALLGTLVLLFAFQGAQIVQSPLHIFLIAIPLAIQTYFIFFLSWFSGRYLGIQYQICAPAAMIGASNFFELAVAVAIVLFGMDSGATLATVVGVLIEVPVMLSLVYLAKRWRY